MNKDRLLDIFSKIQKDEIPNGFHLNSRVLIIDGMNTFLRSFAVVNKMSTVGHDVGGLIGFLRSLGHSIKLLNPTRVVIVFDGEAGSQNRKYLYPPYKANRTTTKQMNYKSFSTKTDEDDSKYEQIVRLVDYLEYLPILNISIDRLEADDVIGFLTNSIYNQYEDSQIFVMSSDNDFMQLVNNRVKLYSPTKKRIYNSQDILSEYGVHPNNFLLFKTLVGDTSDNITGVQGFGKTNTPKMFDFMGKSEPKSLGDLYEICRNPPKNSVLYEKILNTNKDVEIFYKIMNLKEPNISDIDRESIMDSYHSLVPMFRKSDFIKTYNQDRMGGAIQNVETWLNLFSTLNSYRQN